MSDIAFGAIKTNAITIYRPEGFTGYTGSLFIKSPLGVTKTLVGAIDSTDIRKYDFASIVGDIPEPGTYQAQLTLTNVGGEDFSGPIFEIFIHEVLT